ncbi:MAG: hypothetical protein ACRDE5_07990, partial [Ginsengibacter sp.]
FFLMHIHAFRKRNELELTLPEIFDTKTKIYKNFILILIGLVSIVVTLILTPEKAGMTGFIYFLIGPAFSVFFRYRDRKKNKLFPVNMSNE